MKEMTTKIVAYWITKALNNTWFRSWYLTKQNTVVMILINRETNLGSVE